MRPQQQNRRMRGRNNNNNNNNRKGPNPLTRSYESNGPDVKIRGTAQQVAEKYAALARDAMSSGDRVMAENYLQHAEHYNRIIAAAQAQFAAQNPQLAREEAEEDEEERDDLEAMGGIAGPHQQHQRDHRWREQRDQHENGQPQQPINGTGPQPVIEGTPAEIALGEENPIARRPRTREREQAVPQKPAADAETRQEQPKGEAGQANEAGHVNGVSTPEPAQAAEAEAEEGAAARRPRRPRRPRRTAAEAGEANAEASAPGSEAGASVEG